VIHLEGKHLMTEQNEAESMKRVRIRNRAVSLKGNDIDTDRIIPGRFMKWIAFEGLGAHVFEDARLEARRNGGSHPFDEPRFAGASILFVNKNFGCGSSREHAPQALYRHGIRAIIGESFGEIFAGNCVSVGLPCVQADAETVASLQQLNQDFPDLVFTLDLETKTIAAGNHVFPVNISEGRRTQYVEGRWDGTTVLLTANDAIEKTARSLPYMNRG
jgi:3-isopropylmalate/(R)-2-methylmalate dehydratase small subunit